MVDGCHFIPSFQISRACGSPTTSLCFNRLDYSHYVSGCRKARCNRPCLFHYDQHRPYLDILGIHAGYTGTDLHLPFFCPEYFSCRMRQKREQVFFTFMAFAYPDFLVQPAWRVYCRAGVAGALCPGRRTFRQKIYAICAYSCRLAACNIG